jgi:3'(2'), 5'-bisphosphate nucleotidase
VERERATAAVIHAPVSGNSWLGELGEGAYQAAADGSRQPIAVSSLSSLAEARIVGSRSHRNPALEQALAALGARELVALGSAGLKASVVAHGAADAYVAPHYAGKRWDACAADALISAAGGKLTNARGELFDYRSEHLDNDRGIVASNGLLHDAILEKLAAVRA